MIYLIIFMSVLTIALLIVCFIKIKESNSLKNKYKDIIDIEKAVNDKNNELKVFQDNFEKNQKEITNQKNQLEIEIAARKLIHTNLTNEISILEENLEDISYGLYKPHFNFEASEDYKKKLDQIYNLQKQMIKDEKATYCSTEWTVGNSKVEGRKMTKQNSKLMLRAFNGECDSAIAKVSWNNMTKMEARIEKAYEAINKMGETNKIIVTKEYFKLKMDELRLAFEYQEKLEQEREEQRQIKEQMREEEKARRELEKAQKEAEEEEKRYQKALEEAEKKLADASGKELDVLNEKIALLHRQLEEAQRVKERAISQAQLTKSGHVYIISNIGSFGEEVYKIGMTRRLEPMDRVKELGDASVPFEFDVHAMIYSEDAPGLETKLQQLFNFNRVNRVNERKEFFRVTLDEIEKAVLANFGEFHLTKLAEAREYRETLAIIEKETTKN